MRWWEPSFGKLARSLAGALALIVCWTAAALAQGPQGPHHNSIAVIIGNQKYQHTTPVIYAHNDARAIERYLVDRLGFRRSNVIVRLDIGREQMESLFGEPDRADGELMDRLLDRRTEARGDVFVFYSGHGVPDPDAVHDDARRAFLLPVDVSQSRINQAAFPIDRLTKKLELVRGHLPPDRKVVMMLDACFSGRTPIAKATPGGDMDASLFKFSRGSFSVRAGEPTAGLVRLIAATGDQVAYWDEPRKLGLFTSLFLRGVSGEADGPDFGNGDRIVTGDELLRYLEERVPAEARLRHQRTQRPTLDGLDRFAWTLPRPGQLPAAPIVPAPVRAQPAALSAPASPAAAPPPPQPPAPAVAARPAPQPVAPAPAAPKPVAAPSPPPKSTPPARAARPAAEEEEAAKPAPRRRTARAAPRPAVEEDDEPVRPRARPRPRPVERAVAPRPAAEPGGGCRVINGVRFCG